MEIDFINKVHSSTKRNYLERVNDKDFPKYKAASLAKKFDYDYWDGDRRICYGGYKYIPGRWEGVAKDIINFYRLNKSSKVLDVGCGKGFLLYEIKKLIPEIVVRGVDISQYAIDNSKPEIKNFLSRASAKKLPFDDKSFDLVFSINTLHNLYSYDLFDSLKEIQRVTKSKSYICVESYRNEEEKANLLYWQVTCEAFNTPEEWLWWFKIAGYKGDHSFIYFN